MKKAYKWMAIAVLCAILIATVLLTSPTLPQTDDATTPPDTEDVFTEQSGSSEEGEEMHSSTLPKLPLLSPFSPSGYLQCIGGSGRDEVKSVWQANGFVLAIGETTSYDYDLFSSEGSVFVAKVNQSGILLSVTTVKTSTALIDSKLYGQNLFVLTKNPSSAELTLFDSSLRPTRALTLEPCTEGYLLLSENHLYVLLKYESSFLIKKYSLDLTLAHEAGYTFSSVITVEDFSYIDGNITLLIGCGSAQYACSFCDELTLDFQKKLTFLEGSAVLSSLPALFLGKSGYVALCKDSQNGLFVTGFTLDGILQWSSPLEKGDGGALLRAPSGRYLVFTKAGSTSSAHLLCAHGDVIEKSIPSLSGSFPVEYTYSGEGLVVLTKSLEEERGAVIFVDKNDSPSLCFSFPSCSPKALCISNDGQITVGAVTSSYSSPFGSGRGELSCFIFGLKD